MGHEQMLEYGFVLLVWVHGAARALLEIMELVIYSLAGASSAPRFVATVRPSTSFF